MHAVKRGYTVSMTCEIWWFWWFWHGRGTTSYWHSVLICFDTSWWCFAMLRHPCRKWGGILLWWSADKWHQRSRTSFLCLLEPDAEIWAEADGCHSSFSVWLLELWPSLCSTCRLHPSVLAGQFLEIFAAVHSQRRRFHYSFSSSVWGASARRARNQGLRMP